MINLINKSLKNIYGSNQAQSLNEYAIVLAVVITVLVSMQVFIKRRTQAVLLDSFREFGNTNFIGEYNPIAGKSETSGYDSLVTSSLRRESSGANEEHLTGSDTLNRIGNVARQEAY